MQLFTLFLLQMRRWIIGKLIPAHIFKNRKPAVGFFIGFWASESLWGVHALWVIRYTCLSAPSLPRWWHQRRCLRRRG